MILEGEVRGPMRPDSKILAKMVNFRRAAIIRTKQQKQEKNKNKILTVSSPSLLSPPSRSPLRSAPACCNAKWIKNKNYLLTISINCSRKN